MFRRLADGLTAGPSGAETDRRLPVRAQHFPALSVLCILSQGVSELKELVCVPQLITRADYPDGQGDRLLRSAAT